MPVLKFPGFSHDEWRGQKLDDKIMDAGMRAFEKTRRNPTVTETQEELDNAGVDVQLYSDDDCTIIVQKGRKKR